MPMWRSPLVSKLILNIAMASSQAVAGPSSNRVVMARSIENPEYGPVVIAFVSI